MKLTHIAKAAGWAAKIGPGDLHDTLADLNVYRDSKLEVGFETSDDAGVFKIDEAKSLVQTVDFITPVVDDPYKFGQIAALNSLSDVYAMGGTPITAMSILMYNCDIDKELIKQMMQGACDELRKANCTLVGGHTVEDQEVKLGFSVTGTVDNGKFYRNSTLRTGDLLIYTKPLGIGIVATAVKGELANAEETTEIEAIMLRSNGVAAELLKKYDVSACTDVTGFGLAGHGFEMAAGSKKSIIVEIDKIQFIASAIKYAEMGIIPAGAYSNKQFMDNDYLFSSGSKEKEIVLFDPQTAGGLLIGVAKEDARQLLADLSFDYPGAVIIGKVTDQSETAIHFI